MGAWAIPLVCLAQNNFDSLQQGYRYPASDTLMGLQNLSDESQYTKDKTVNLVWMTIAVGEHGKLPLISRR